MNNDNKVLIEYYMLGFKDELDGTTTIIPNDNIDLLTAYQVGAVDAIVGATRQMHTVLIDECTGCDLCVAPCPVDCIEMRPIPETIQNWQWDLNKIAVKQID